MKIIFYNLINFSEIYKFIDINFVRFGYYILLYQTIIIRGHSSLHASCTNPVLACVLARGKFTVGLYLFSFSNVTTLSQAAAHLLFIFDNIVYNNGF